MVRAVALEVTIVSETSRVPEKDSLLSKNLPLRAVAGVSLASNRSKAGSNDDGRVCGVRTGFTKGGDSGVNPGT